MKKIMAMAFALCIAGLFGIAAADEQIMISRNIQGDVIAGETFEVRLAIDVDEENIPPTYVLAEEVPNGFEVVETDARVTSEDNVMKWVEIEGLFGKIEDKEYLYTLRAPAETGEYTIAGMATLRNNTIVGVGGDTTFNVREMTESDSTTASADSKTTGQAVGTADSEKTMAMYGLGGIVLLAIGYAAYRKSRNQA